ncbi:NAD(P)H-dependent oxidoreductase [Nocardia sp. NPDC050712]|uniref:FMN-dependent NADH-azoreductase n=1 Tax=Nocardia sp. NPDC050712 TaxID=3155518 RepID=UPI00340BEE78
MSTLYRVDTSVQAGTSVTHEIADEFESAWRAAHPGGEVTRRDLVHTPLSPAVWTEALAAREADHPTAAQTAAVEFAAALATEVLAADALVIGAPLYNWGVSEHLKCWIDMLWTDPRFAPRTYPLTGTPVTLVVARGGGTSPGAPQEGWDHSVPFLRHTFGTVFGAEVTLIETELTLAEHSPAMAHLRDRAVALRANSHALARAAGAGTVRPAA